MKLSRKLALVVLPLAAILAGCQAPKTGSTTAPATAQAQQQGASVEVFVASDKVVKGYRPVKISENQTIYVATAPVLTRAQLTNVEPVKDNQGRVLLRLTPTAEGAKALNAVPNDRGYVTVVGGQVASLSGIRQNNEFYFLTRDEQTAANILSAIFGK